MFDVAEDFRFRLSDFKIDTFVEDERLNVEMSKSGLKAKLATTERWRRRFDVCLFEALLVKNVY